MAQHILLELDYLKLLRRRKHWNIYFTLATNSPTDPSKMLVTALPGGGTIKMTKGSDNAIHFVPEGDEGGSGLFVFRHEMPIDHSVQVRLWVMQSRKALKEVGKVLEGISGFLSKSTGVTDILSGLGVTQPWITAEKVINKGIGGVGSALDKTGDRNLGFINMDEHFGDIYDKDPERDYHGKVSTGYAEIGWTWRVFNTQ